MVTEYCVGYRYVNCGLAIFNNCNSQVGNHFLNSLTLHIELFKTRISFISNYLNYNKSDHFQLLFLGIKCMSDGKIQMS